MHRLGRIALIAVLLSSGLMALAWLATDDPPPGAYGERSFAEVFQRPVNRAEVMVNRRDGPAFAQLATDLTLDRPEDFHDYFAGSEPSDELAYRAGRPLMSWVTWAISAGGRRPLLAPALMLITVAGLGATAAAIARIATIVGRDPTWAWTAVLLPGLGVSIWAPGGCEPLATALVLCGWALWSFERRTRLPLLLFSLAALTRETSLIVPVALALIRDEPPRRRLALVVPALIYGTWVLVVRWQTGGVPGNAGGGRVSALFGGLIEQMPQWGANEWTILAIIVGLGALAYRSGLPAVGWVLALHLALSSTLGPLVWEQAIDFSRIFVIVEVVGLIGLLPRADSETWGPFHRRGTLARLDAE